eukprot:Hpha_TRINITY_DN29865_c0_g1::TRINITY_DN29865_c0_g1_i1::g.2880::m.2880
MARRTSPVLYPGGVKAKITTVPPPPWRKMREQAHLQKFKEFNLKEFPWTAAQSGLLGERGGKLWADPRALHAERLLREQQWKSPQKVRVEHPDLPPEGRREAVPSMARAVLASHIRGRGGGYGLTPEQVNIATTIRSQKPELDTAKNDEPRTAHARWAQYRAIEMCVRVSDLALSLQARRRLEALVPELLHDGMLTLHCDAYEDFWDNYEWSNVKLLQIVADAKKADLDPQYWPMEQYKVREPRGRLRAAESLQSWHTLQSESIVLGKRYADMKEKGVESVTAFQLYETPAYKVANQERAAQKRIEVRLTGLQEGYSVDKISAAMSQARERMFDIEEEREDEMPDVGDLHGEDRGAVELLQQARMTEEDEDGQSRVDAAFAGMDRHPPVAPPPTRAEKREASSGDDALSSVLEEFGDFVPPDDEE